MSALRRRVFLYRFSYTVNDMLYRYYKLYGKEKGKALYPNRLDLGSNCMHWARLSGVAHLAWPSCTATRATAVTSKAPAQNTPWPWGDGS